jgi:hypothetical protein
MSSRYTILPRLVEILAETEGCAPNELDYSLQEYIETDALVTLAASDHTDWRLTFQVPDHTVEVRGSGNILVDDTRYAQPEEVENQTT